MTFHCPLKSSLLLLQADGKKYSHASHGGTLWGPPSPHSRRGAPQVRGAADLHESSGTSEEQKPALHAG